MFIKSKLILLVAFIVSGIVYILLMSIFDAFDIDTKFYGYSPNFAAEELEWGESNTFAGLYSTLISVLLGVKMYWLLAGEIPGFRKIDKIEFKIGWLYIFVGLNA